MMPESDLEVFANEALASWCCCFISMQVWRHVAAERAASQTLLQAPGGTEWEFQDELKLPHVTDNKQDKRSPATYFIPVRIIHWLIGQMIIEVVKAWKSSSRFTALLKEKVVDSQADSHVHAEVWLFHIKSDNLWHFQIHQRLFVIHFESFHIYRQKKHLMLQKLKKTSPTFILAHSVFTWPSVSDWNDACIGH